MDIVNFHALPEAGGLRDQPVKLMKTIRAVMNVYKAVTAYNRDGKTPGKVAKWRQENPGVWRVVTQVKRLREELARGRNGKE